MLIMIDESIWGVPEIFEDLGEIRTFAGRSLRPADVADADAVVVRSVTRVDGTLLAGSRVRFVGTATSGVDHVDAAWLEAHGITFATAAGCNARPVAEYVLAAVLLLAERMGFDPPKQAMGVVGVGHCGSRVARWARALGMGVLLCDPPLQRQTSGTGVSPVSPREPRFIDAAELARQSDIVTLHVPLTRSGADSTWDMVDEEWLSHLKPGAILVNTSRGEVVREDDLLAAKDAGRLGGVVLDVWRNEPDVREDLVQRVDIATPHIAGSSVEAKRRGGLMIRTALADFLRRQCGVEVQSTSSDAFAEAKIVADGTEPIGAMPLALGGDWWRDVATVVRSVCDLASADRAFREAVSRLGSRACFDELRTASASRREFGPIRLGPSPTQGAAGKFLSEIGFQIRP
ncbi:MAG: 4-phosphoerythronate dehydrogenase [Phycisphaerae bacterium]|nr:4-phosphoerythronate dehydrogenase [Phycisphaerae bacterium]